MLSEPAVWGCLPSGCLLFLLLWTVLFLKACLPISRPEDLLGGVQFHSADAHGSPAMGSGRWASLGEVQLQLIPTQRCHHPLGEALVLCCSMPSIALGRKQDLTGGAHLFKFSSESGSPSHTVWKGKDTGDWKTTSLFMTEDVTAFTKCQGKPFPGSVF